MDINDILALEESQTFDRKSININPKDFAIPLIAFANADGGMIAVGISDKTKRIEGIDGNINKINELRRVPYDYCNPTIDAQFEEIECIDDNGNPNHILLVHVKPSLTVHVNQAEQAFKRIGDKSKLLRFNDHKQLFFDKGDLTYEDMFSVTSTITDLDLNLVNDYIKRIGYSKTAEEYLIQNHNFINKNGNASYAALLLFGKNPQSNTKLSRAYIRIIKYDGTEAQTGTRMNVIQDKIFTGTILNMIKSATDFLDTQIKKPSYLNSDGTFTQTEEYPKFVRQELIVNAVTHRDYNIQGREIRIQIFDDRLVVESPGVLPQTVNTSNIRYTHFSRNPKIAEFLRVYNYVKEYGEGVDRIYEDLANAKMQDPIYSIKSFTTQVIIYNKKNIKSKQTNINITNNQDIKISKQDFLDLINAQNYNNPTIKKLELIYNSIDSNQIFSATDIANITKSSKSTSKLLLEKLRDDLTIIVVVKGHGRGKYRFKNISELPI